RQRVAVLPEVARELLGIAAVVGRVVEPALLTAVAVQPEGEGLAALDAAGRAHLLVEQDHAYQFAHDVIREVIEDHLGVARRQALHRRVAEALEQQPGKPAPERLAYHYTRSDRPDKAVPYLERAGDRARDHYAHVAAAG